MKMKEGTLIDKPKKEVICVKRKDIRVNIQKVYGILFDMFYLKTVLLILICNGKQEEKNNIRKNLNNIRVFKNIELKEDLV